MAKKTMKKQSKMSRARESVGMSEKMEGRLKSGVPLKKTAKKKTAKKKTAKNSSTSKMSRDKMSAGTTNYNEGRLRKMGGRKK